jgi:dihydropyrimidinase
VGADDEKCTAAPVDLALVDLDAEWTLERSDVISSAGYSIYEGQRLKGRVRDAFVRGRAVLCDDTPLNVAVGHGRHVRRRLLSRSDDGRG